MPSDRYAQFYTVAGAAEAAALAIGRLDQALHHHPLRLAWAHRARLRSALAAVALNGWRVDAEVLYARLAGLPIRHEHDYGAASRALRMAWAIATTCGDKALADDGADYDDADAGTAEDTPLRLLVSDARLLVEQMHEARERRGAILLGAADTAWDMRWQTDVEPGVIHAALPAYLAQAGLTSVPLYGLAAFPARGERDERDEWTVSFLKALAKAADAERSHLGGLGLAWQGWVQKVESRPRRSTSSLPVLLPLVAQSPALSPVLASKCLGVTVRGSSLLLNELEELGVVIEVTGRRAGRLFVAADLRPDSRGRAPSPSALATKVAARSLDATMSEVDAALARVERLLGGPPGKHADGEDDEDLLPRGWMTADEN